MTLLDHVQSTHPIRMVHEGETFQVGPDPDMPGLTGCLASWRNLGDWIFDEAQGNRGEPLCPMCAQKNIIGIACYGNWLRVQKDRLPPHSLKFYEADSNQDLQVHPPAEAPPTDDLSEPETQRL